ncbi:SulP family inorganic anion transporter [Blautia stercoris]
MNGLLFPTLKNYKKEYFKKDIFSGIIMAAVSIPISMGYAQIAGLPAVYGLYGSVFPILFFALFSTSKQFIFGVDAAPAAIVGAALVSLGIESGSKEAMQYVPVIALLTGLWLLLFYFLKAGRIVDFISTPVMGGFISGIALTIILMQIPKILGGKAGSGELPELAHHILETCKEINWLSVVLGVGALVILRLAGKLIPKFPMAIVIMAVGVIATLLFRVDEQGVILLDAVESGLPKIHMFQFAGIDWTQAAGRSLMIAAVIMSETLLSENNFALKNGYKIDENKEILACAAGNLASACVGCCPVNGSISRTSMNEQYEGKTQAVSITAGAVMAVVLVCATGFIGYLPVPVLTAIVISALMNVVELHLAIRLFKVSRNEFYIFVAACISVLFLGTIYGVVIGLLLSFIAVVLRATNPPRTFYGMIPSKEAYYDLKRNRNAYPIKNTIIYRFSENLFFANIKIFQSDIENSIKKDTKVVIVDATAINSIDITAADRLEMMAKNLEKQGIRFYITEHSENVNQQMRSLGIGHLIEEGKVRRTILAALHDAGIPSPCPLEIPEKVHAVHEAMVPAEEENTLEEFAWAFGDDAVEEIEKRVHQVMEQLHKLPDLERLAELGIEEKLKNWHSLGAIDEDEILRRMELHLDELPENLRGDRKVILQLIEKRRRKIEQQLLVYHPEIVEHLKKSRERLEKRLEKQNPEAARKLHKWEEEIREKKEP